MPYVIRASIEDPDAPEFMFRDQKSMYGGWFLGPGDVICLFASETQGGRGLGTRGPVAKAKLPGRPPPAKGSTSRHDLRIRSAGRALRSLGPTRLKPPLPLGDGAPRTELDFRFY